MPLARTVTVGYITVAQPPVDYTDDEADRLNLTDSVVANLTSSNALAPSQLLAPSTTLAPQG